MNRNNILLILLCLTVLAACSKKPENVADDFYKHLRTGHFKVAQEQGLPQIAHQVDIIAHDKDALFNGQQWNYSLGNTIIKQDSAQVSVEVKLNDSSDIRQLAKLCKTTGGWKVSEIINTKINYSRSALKARLYNQYGKQMLIAPLDIEYIDEATINKYSGKYILVTGYLCGFDQTGKLLKMTMGDINYKPLLSVLLTGKALERAVKEHKDYMTIDTMVETPLGNVFTIVGLLNKKNDRLSIKTNHPQDIMIGPFLRPERVKP